MAKKTQNQQNRTRLKKADIKRAIIAARESLRGKKTPQKPLKRSTFHVVAAK